MMVANESDYVVCFIRKDAVELVFSDHGLLPNVKRVHHYQRGRTSITGLRFWIRKDISTKRLVVVVMSRLVLLLLFVDFVEQCLQGFDQLRLGI